MTDPLQFTLAVLLLLAAPGPTNTVLATAGAVNRAEGPLAFIGAEVVAYFVVVLACGLVLLPLIQRAPLIEPLLKLVVALFLLYAALRLWRLRVAAAEKPRRVTLRLVFITTLLNPKGLAFAVAIIPSQPPLSWHLAAFALMAATVGLGWFYAGRSLAHLSGSHASMLPRLGAVLLVGFAGYLAVTTFN